MNELVSVILPVYNRKALLPDCMESLFAQSHDQLQIILIDDGSTDGTLELCRDYAAKDSRILLLEGAHQGVSAARNMGLDAAVGKYLFFVDSDDAIHPQLIKTLYDAMETHNAPMGSGWIINVPASRWQALPDHIAKQNAPSQVSFHSFEETIQKVYDGHSPFGLIGGTMFRRDFVGQTRFRTDLFIGEDYYFIYQNLIKGASSVFLKQRWYYCRIHGSNSSDSYGYDGFWTRFYRRKLVWESEDALGRPENAAKEKHSAFMAYLTCVKVNQMPRDDLRKMCAVMKQYRKEILPALNFPRKVRFYMTVYFPFTHRLYCKIFKK